MKLAGMLFIASHRLVRPSYRTKGAAQLYIGIQALAWTFFNL